MRLRKLSTPSKSAGIRHPNFKEIDPISSRFASCGNGAAYEPLIVLVLTGLLIGCGIGVVGVAVALVAAQSFAPSPVAPRWQQFCEASGINIERVNRLLAERGEQGWELVQMAGVGGTAGAALCFKRPAPTTTP